MTPAFCSLAGRLSVIALSRRTAENPRASSMRELRFSLVGISGRRSAAAKRAPPVAVSIGMETINQKRRVCRHLHETKRKWRVSVSLAKAVGLK